MTLSMELDKSVQNWRASQNRVQRVNIQLDVWVFSGVLMELGRSGGTEAWRENEEEHGKISKTKTQKCFPVLA